MEPSPGPHIGDEDLESYLLHRLPDAEAAAAEEHLLLCDACRKRVEETESYLRAIRTALSRVEREEAAKEGPALWRAAWGIAAAVAAFLVVVWMWPRGAVSPIAVGLQASRGPAHSQAPAGRPLDLSMDLTEVAAFPSYRVELVDARGARLWEGPAAVEQGRAATRVTAKLSAGHSYYIRLYSPAKELLREYGLEAY
jgi:anti-sigma factor RsiW